MSKFNDYQAFVTIVEKNNLTEAANVLNRSVSAVSKQLTKLENSLNVNLIDRSTQALSVTDAGMGFYEKCKNILDAVEDAEQSLKDQSEMISGRLVITFPEVLIRCGIMDFLSDFNEHYPEIKFDIRVSNYIDSLIEDKIDFAFRIGALDESRLTAIRLESGALVACASPKYIARYGMPKSYKELFIRNHLILPSYINISDQLKKQFSSKNGVNINISKFHISNNEAAILEMLKKGMGAAFLLDFSIVDEIYSGELMSFKMDKTLPFQDINLIFHKKGELQTKMRIFKDYVKCHYNDFFPKTHDVI